MIFNHVNQVGVIFGQVFNKVKYSWDVTDFDTKLWGAGLIVLCICVFAGIATAIYSRGQIEIDRRDYNRIKEYVEICPVKEDVAAAFANDGIITKWEAADITSKCTEFIEIKNRNKARDEVKEIITSTENES